MAKPSTKNNTTEEPKECKHCNGYGSSLKEEADICTHCNGTGLEGGKEWWNLGTKKHN